MKNFECIVLIDDDTINNFITRRLLTSSSNEIYDFVNAIEAIEFIQNYFIERGKYPDLIVLDINMPIMNGFEFMERIKELNIPLLNVIVLTTSDVYDDLEKMKKLGVRDFIIKPLTVTNVKEIKLKHLIS